MDAPAKELLRHLLTEVPVLALAVEVEDRPAIGVLPFFAAPDFSCLFVHASRLARHTRGLAEGAPFSAAIQADRAADDDPLAVPRLLLDGHVELPGAEETETLAELWAASFPSAAMTLALSDFSFFRLRIETGRLVAGFGRAFGVGPRVLAEVAAPAGGEA